MENKGEFIRDAIQSVAEARGTDAIVCYLADVFTLFPNGSVPFDIEPWVVNLLSRSRTFEYVIGRSIQGHSLKSEVNFRLFWEIPLQAEIRTNGYWSTLYNGAEFCRYATPLRDVTRYGDNGNAVRDHVSTVLRNRHSQQRAGIGWGKRGDFTDAHIMPEGCVFTVEGQGLPLAEHRWLALGLMNSDLFWFLLNLFCGQHKYSGYVNSCPVPALDDRLTRVIETSVSSAASIVRQSCIFDETTREFCYPRLGSADPSIRHGSARIWDEARSEAQRLTAHGVDLNRAVEQWYEVQDTDLDAVRAFCRRAPSARASVFPWASTQSVALEVTEDILSYAAGVAFGRWDIRVARDRSLAPALADAFGALPTSPPAMLVSPDGRPAREGSICRVEWLRARTNTITRPPATATATDDYPLQIAWDGVLVDDLDHPNDIVRRVRAALTLLWPDGSGTDAEGIEREACTILGMRELREYFAGPASFFAGHLKRYTKSRRQAPIYWPLSTASGSYTLWLYYHRLSSDTLFTAVNRYLDPKLEQVRRKAVELRSRLDAASGRDATGLREQRDRVTSLLRELEELRGELLRVAGLPYQPNLDDGVIINSAPLHRLIRNRDWAKATRECWAKLERGDYDWAHLAYTLWPERVQLKCRTEKSLAIAHGREDLYREAGPLPAGRSGRRAGAARRS